VFRANNIDKVCTFLQMLILREMNMSPY